MGKEEGEEGRTWKTCVSTGTVSVHPSPNSSTQSATLRPTPLNSTSFSRAAAIPPRPASTNVARFSARRYSYGVWPAALEAAMRCAADEGMKDAR